MNKPIGTMATIAATVAATIVTAALLTALPPVASPAAADAGVSVWIGDGCCYPHRHHHYYSDWGRPMYLVPPPVIYAPPPMVYGAPPPVAYAVPPGSVQAAPASPDYTDRAGRTCREYQSTVTVGGVRRPSYGTACLMSDGSWRIVN